MRLGRVTGTVTATVKDPQLVGLKLLLADVIDADGKILQAAVVAADACGAGVGDRVLIATGTAARIPASVTGRPVDCSIVSVVDRVTIANSS